MVAPIKTTITYEDLEKLDVRVGTIVKVEDVEESDKLVKLTVDLGEQEMRTILVGMKKERKDPKAEVEGKQALFVVNLPYKKMMGIESQGMLFDIGMRMVLCQYWLCRRSRCLVEREWDNLQ